MSGSRTMRRWVGGGAAACLWSMSGMAAGAPPAPNLSTEGVVVFGCGTATPDRGTYRMNPDGSGLAAITTLIYPNDASRGVSPVTVLLNAGTNGAVGDIYAQRADGSNAPVPLLVSSTVETQLRFSPDGQRIAYATTIVGTPNLFTISVADVVRDGAGDVTGIANVAVVWGPAANSPTRGLDFSSDGTHIVYAAGYDGYDLWVLTLSSGAVERVTNTPEIEEYPRWSPVDDRIAYQQRADGGTAVGSLFTLDYGTRVRKTVLAGGSKQYATQPCWSPGGTHLLALTGGSGKPLDLYQYPSTGGTKGVNVTGGTTVQPNTPCWGW